MKIIKTSFIILIFISYIIILGRPLSPEISYSPLWVVDLETSGITPFSPGDNSTSFHLDGKLGYINDAGGVLFSEDLLYGVAIDEEGFINYSRQNDVLIVKDPGGHFLSKIEHPGYPFFTGNRRFILSYDNNDVSEINLEGNILWQKTYSAALSSVSAAGSLVFTGTVDGGIQLIDTSGELVFSKDIKSSRINVVYGGSVSIDGEYMVTVTGIDPQLITLWSKNGNSYQVNSTWSLDSELRRHGITGFSDDGLFAYVEAEKELLLIDLKKKKLYSRAMTGRLQYIDFPGDSGLISILGRDDNGFYLMILEQNINPLFYLRIASSDVLLKKNDNRIIIGIDSKLIAYNMESM